ncbi:hypothetical protein NDU88_007905 [Pleurodeles waltl]|uniref:Uncharacterized protein n=1 Tax=Pleurodeles waltl TaxID=8319 RepID=A0AAV7SU53_PLEWA|nr:hypothetical protein NDU88_007905 [Pleurodeles waltl]
MQCTDPLFNTNDDNKHPQALKESPHRSPRIEEPSSAQLLAEISSRIIQSISTNTAEGADNLLPEQKPVVWAAAETAPEADVDITSGRSLLLSASSADVSPGLLPEVLGQESSRRSFGIKQNNAENKP